MGLEGIDEPDEQALYVNPYDAGAASEGTQDRYQRMVSRRRITAPGQHRPWTAPRQSPSSTAWRRKHRKSRAGMGKCKAGSNGKWKRGMVLLHKRQQQPRRDGVAKPKKRKNEKAAQNNVGRVPFANNSGRHGQGSARIMFLNDARWQKVTSKCKNMKRWTQQTKIKEENAKKGSVERMAMRELLGSTSEKAIICSW